MILKGKWNEFSNFSVLDTGVTSKNIICSQKYLSTIKHICFCNYILISVTLPLDFAQRLWRHQRDQGRPAHRFSFDKSLSYVCSLNFLEVKIIMVNRCVAGGCSNTCKDNVSLYHFPKDLARRRLWTRQVKITRDKWTGPTEHSTLCSAHFSDECFEKQPTLMKEFGLKQRQKYVLKESAIPTLFPKPTTDKKCSPKKRQETIKRLRSKVSVCLCFHSGL